MCGGWEPQAGRYSEVFCARLHLPCLLLHLPVALPTLTPPLNTLPHNTIPSNTPATNTYTRTP
jgi:hypothetical protein